MPWDIGADQTSFSSGVLYFHNGRLRPANYIRTVAGQEFYFNLGAALRLKNDLRLDDGKVVYFGTSGSGISMSVINGRLTLTCPEIDLAGSVLPAGRMEIGDFIGNVGQITNLLATNIYRTSWSGLSPRTTWDIGADQFYRPVPAAWGQDGKLIFSNELGASDGAWWLDSDGNGHLDGYADMDSLKIGGSGVIDSSRNVSPNSYVAASGTIINEIGFISPISSDDAAAPNNSIYFSTDQSAVSYKDSIGSIHVLY